MEDNRKQLNWKTAVIVIMAFLLLFCLAKINDFNEKNEELNNEIMNLTNRITGMQNEINSIYENVDEQLKKEASLLSGVDFSIGELNTEESTVAVTLSVVPKTVTDDMKMNVSIDGRTAELTKNGSSFVGVIDVGLFLEYEQRPLLTIETATGTKTEFLEDVDVSTLFGKYLPTVDVSRSGESKYTDDKLNVELEFSIDTNLTFSNTSVTFTSLTLIEEVNGKEINRKDISDKVNKMDNLYTLTYSEDFQVSMGDELKVWLVAEDSLGYIHKTLAHSWYESEDGAIAETVYGGESIYDKNGNLLYGEMN